MLVLVIYFSCNPRLKKLEHSAHSPNEFADSSYINPYAPIPSIPNPYLPTDSSINYKYIRASQIHDYSNNWDLDGDGLLDDLMFVGTGGAHTIFSLVVRLKSQKDAYTFECISTDFPKLESITILEMSDSIAILPKFVIYDFNSDGILDVYLNIDDGAVDVCMQERARLGLKTSRIVIEFNTGKPVFKDYSPFHKKSVLIKPCLGE